MRNTLLMLAFFIGQLSSYAWAEDYVLTVNGTEQEIDLDTPTTLALPDGTSLKLTLRQKDYLRFKTDMFSFEHKNIYKPSRNDLGDGIFQTMAVTPLGTGILVQEYTTMNPSTLVDTMLHELTKEEVEYGYKYNETPIERKIGKITLKGKQAITTYTGEEWTRIVLAYGKKDRGLLVMTFVEKDNAEAEKDILERFWTSLRFAAELE